MNLHRYEFQETAYLTQLSFNFTAVENHHPGPLKILHVFVREHFPCDMLRDCEEIISLNFWTTTCRTEKEERQPQERTVCKLL